MESSGQSGSTPLRHWLLLHQPFRYIVPPCGAASRHTPRTSDATISTNAVSLEQATSLDDVPLAGSSDIALSVVVPIIFGVVLIVATLFMPKKFFLDLSAKVRCKSRKAEAKARTRSSFKSPDIPPAPVKHFQLTFGERHLEMLRAWEKPMQLPQRPLPLYLAKPDSTFKSCSST